MVARSKDSPLPHSTRNAFGQTMQRSGRLLGGGSWYSTAKYRCRTECQRGLQTWESAAESMSSVTFTALVPQSHVLCCRESIELFSCENKQYNGAGEPTVTEAVPAHPTDGDEGPNSVDRGFRNNSEWYAFSCPACTLLFCGLHRKCLLQYTRLINSSFLA